MRLAQYADSTGCMIGVYHRGSWINYTKAEAFYSLTTARVAIERMTTLSVLLESEQWDPERIREVLRFVDSAGLGRSLRISKTALLKAPLARPPKIIALGLNYELHAKEGSFAVPNEPVIFVKAGSSVIGPGETIRIPKGMGRIDHEVELAVVIGKQARRVTKKEAYRYIAGYTILNDVTARDLQTTDLARRHPWFRSKSFDTFTPLGPWVVTADEIRPPVRLDLECRVNGKLRQKANTRDLVFDIPTVIEFITRHITLDAGDLLSTGTPAGIGPITHGDTVICLIERIGKLENPVRYQ